MPMEPSLVNKVNEWLTPTFDEATQAAIREMMTTNPKELEESFYKNLEFGRVWGGVSYRQSFDGKVFDPNDAVGPQKLQYITPIVGLNYQKFMVAYTYSYLSGNVKFDNGGFHQITLGIDLFCKDSKYDCNCPAVN